MMTTSGWVFLTLFWGFVFMITGWCFKLVLLEKPAVGGGGGTGPAEADDQEREKPWEPPDAGEENGQ